MTALEWALRACNTETRRDVCADLFTRFMTLNLASIPLSVPRDMLKTVRNSIPGKPFLKRVLVDPIRRLRSDRAIDQAIQGLRKRRKDWLSLRRAWKNDGFVGDSRYLEEAFERAKGKTVLELGTGLTTIVACLVGKSVYALEQDEEWAAKVQRVLDRNGFQAQIVFAPLVRASGYVWYDVAGLQLPATADLVICDGPYVDREQWGAGLHQSWRYGTLPQLAMAGVAIKEILIDDLDDPRSSATLQRWREEFGLSWKTIASATGDCGIGWLNTESK